MPILLLGTGNKQCLESPLIANKMVTPPLTPLILRNPLYPSFPFRLDPVDPDGVLVVRPRPEPGGHARQQPAAAARDQHEVDRALGRVREKSFMRA